MQYVVCRISNNLLRDFILISFTLFDVVHVVHVVVIHVTSSEDFQLPNMNKNLLQFYKRKQKVFRDSFSNFSYLNIMIILIFVLINYKFN